MAREEQLDFRAALAAAAGLEEAAERLAGLASLASRDLSYVQTIQLDKALLATPESATGSHQRLRVAMLGAATLEHLFPAIRVAGLRHGLLLQLRAGGFGQYRQELLGADSPLAATKPDAVLLSLTGSSVFGEVPTALPKAASQMLIDDAVAGIGELWRMARSRLNAMVIQQSMLDSSEPLFGNHDQLIGGAMTRLVSRLNAALADAAADDGVLWLDIARASAQDGLDSWFDIRHWLQGKMEIAPTAAGRYAELLARLLGAHFGRSRKCLVLDLDNTLWGGVIGDDGMTGIRLGEGSAAGEAHLALQKYAKKLQERGVILAVCSKNDPAIAQEVFDRHPEMHLRRGDIAAFAVNWNDKAENLRSIASRLNIGLDSLVFVDDNPAERARIRESLPMVAVPELPDDPASYVRTIARAGYFEATVVTEEDRLRAQQYAANEDRDTLKDSAQSVEEFLAGLRMSVVAGPVTPVELPRVTQLINKTNQFNTTTARAKSEELEQWVAHSKNLALQFRLLDKFGDNGLVSVMLLAGGDTARPDTFELANWVMSCRVFGRQLEHEALNIAVEAARSKGARHIEATYIPTPKNAVVKDLFQSLGFKGVDADAVAEGVTRWRLDVAGYEPHKTHIARKV